MTSNQFLLNENLHCFGQPVRQIFTHMNTVLPVSRRRLFSAAQVSARLLSLALLAALLLPLRLQAGMEEMANAANNFLTALTDEQRAVAVYEVKSDERLNWHFIPKNDRKGLQFKDMTPAQRNLAHALLASGLSQRGYGQAMTIMSLEDILHELEKNKVPPGPTRDPERYYLTIFGKPGPKGAWGWRVEGHHLSQNFTIVDGHEVSATPSFMGTNPAEVRTGPRKGLRVLGVEEDLGRQLIKSLSPDLSKLALIDVKAPKDVITLAEKKVKALDSVGVPYAKLNADQKAQLLKLIKQYLYRCRPEIADQDLAKIEKAGFDKILFAWAGGLELGDGHYYRVQGPTFLLEYDNTQNDANHVHAVWRDFENDFGVDILRLHYAQVPHEK